MPSHFTGNQLLADKDGLEETAALRRLCLLGWLIIWYHLEWLSVSEPDSGVRGMRQVVSLVFFQSHGHRDVFKSKLILDLLMSEAF